MGCQCASELYAVEEFENFPSMLLNFTEPYLDVKIPARTMLNRTAVEPGQVIVATALAEFPKYKAWTYKTCGPVTLRSKRFEPSHNGLSHDTQFFFQVDKDARIESNLTISFKRVANTGGLVNWGDPDAELSFFVSPENVSDDSPAQS